MKNTLIKTDQDEKDIIYIVRVVHVSVELQHDGPQ